MPEFRTLCRHDDYRITLHHPDGVRADMVVVTFGGMPSDLADSGFGTKFCLSQGWTTIHVAQRAMTQYQGLDVAAFRAAAAPAVEGRDVVCYGSSLGGYAALYYGGAIDARIIAAAPRLPAWPPIASPPLAVPLTHQPLADSPRSRAAPVVIYDPQVAHDRTTVDQMIRPAYPALRLVELPFFGHTVFSAIVAAGKLTTFMATLIRDDVLLPLDLPTDTNPGWQLRRGQFLARREPQAAAEHFRRFFVLPRRPAACPCCWTSFWPWAIWRGRRRFWIGRGRGRSRSGPAAADGAPGSQGRPDPAWPQRGPVNLPDPSELHRVRKVKA